MQENDNLVVLHSRLEWTWLAVTSRATIAPPKCSCTLLCRTNLRLRLLLRKQLEQPGQLSLLEHDIHHCFLVASSRGPTRIDVLH